MLQKRCRSFRANSRSLCYKKLKICFAVFSAAVCYGIAVNLILNCGNKVEHLFCGRNSYFPTVFGYCAGSVTVVLYHTEKRNCYMHLIKKFLNRGYMAFAAVQQYQIGHSAKGCPLFTFFSITFKPPAEHFAHTGIVIRSNGVLYGKFSVIRALWPCIFIYYHTADNGFCTKV